MEVQLDNVLCYLVKVGPLPQHWSEGSEVSNGRLIEAGLRVAEVATHLARSKMSKICIVRRVYSKSAC